MLKRKRDPDPTEEQLSSQRKNPRRTGFLKGKQVSVYWAPSDIWAPAIIDKRVRTGVIIKWLSDGTTTLILDAFVDDVIHQQSIPEEPTPEPAAAAKDSWAKNEVMKERENERLRMEQEKQVSLSAAVVAESPPTKVSKVSTYKPQKKKLKANNTIGFRGVSKVGNRFQARIRIEGHRKTLGTFDTSKEAAQAYDHAAIQAGHPTSKLNFLDQVPKNYEPKKKKLQSHNTIGYRGVYKTRNRFQASIYFSGKEHHIGMFGTPKEAAIAFDYAAIQAKRPKCDLNFPDMIHTKTMKKKFMNMKKKKKKRKIKTKKTSTSTKSKNSNKSSSSTSSSSSSSSSSSKGGGGNGGHVLREFPKIRTESSL